MNVDPILEALWKRVVDRWDDDDAHRGFLEHCAEHDRLPEAAARYRGMAGDRHRGATAEKRLAAVATLALAKLESTRTTVPEARRDAGKLVLIVLFIAGTIAMLVHQLD